MCANSGRLGKPTQMFPIPRAYVVYLSVNILFALSFLVKFVTVLKNVFLYEWWTLVQDVPKVPNMSTLPKLPSKPSPPSIKARFRSTCG